MEGFYSRKEKGDPCWLFPYIRGNISMNYDCETSHMSDYNLSLKNTNIKTKNINVKGVQTMSLHDECLAMCV